MSDTKFFRQYLDVLNEGPPPNIGPNAPIRPVAPQQPGQPDTFTKMLPGMGNKALDAGKGLVDPYAKTMANFTPGSPYYQQNVANNPAVKAKVDAFMQTAPTAGQLGADIDATKQSFNQALTAKPTAGGTSTEYEKTAGQTGLPAVPAPTNEETDDMDEGKLMRKYMDFLDEAPAQAINPNDPNAAAFGKQINAPAPNTNIDTRATAQRDKLAQQMASGKINATASQTVNPNQQYGGGYDPTKVQYAAGAKNQQPVNNQSSGYSAQSQAQRSAPISQQPVNNQSSGYSAQSQAQRSAPISQQPVNNQSSGYSAQSQAQRSAPVSSSGATRGASAQATAEPSLASQYISANQPQAQTASKPTPSSPSLASQYISANQPQTATASTTQPTSDVLATQALQAQDQGTSGQSKGVPAAFGQVAEEKGENSDDELLKSIIRLIKQ